MENELMRLLDEFGEGLSKYEYNQYIPKLKHSFVDYIIKEKSNSINVENLFKFEFTRNDIIKSTEYYILNNENVKSKSAIDDFLIALNRFFEETINKYYINQNLIAIRPFTTLSKDIELELSNQETFLLDRQANPQINEDQYKYILEYIKNEDKLTIKTRQVHIIIKLLLLYGFSFDRIANIKKSDYCIEKKTLKIVYNKTPLRIIELEIPYSLRKEFESYLEELKNTSYNNNEYFFTTRNETKIAHDFPNDYLLGIKNSYFSKYKSDINEETLEKNPFTPTGLAKFAIINMILNGINHSVVLDLTGFKNEVYIDCQNEVDQRKLLNKTRYINHKIRGINTFDEL